MGNCISDPIDGVDRLHFQMNINHINERISTVIELSKKNEALTKELITLNERYVDNLQKLVDTLQEKKEPIVLD